MAICNYYQLVSRKRGMHNRYLGTTRSKLYKTSVRISNGGSVIHALVFSCEYMAFSNLWIRASSMGSLYGWV